jgi:multiple sugar transport system permease protein
MNMGNQMTLRRSRKPLSALGWKLLGYLFLILLAALCLFPFYILLINSTRMHPDIIKGFTALPGSAFLRNLTNLLGDQNIPLLRALANSVFISTCCAALTVYFSSMTAYGIYMYRFKGRNFAYNFIMIVMMVPTQVAALGFIRLIISVDLLDTFWPLIIPSIAAPAAFFFMFQYMRSVLPHEIVESARIDGANEFSTFNRISMPILSPALAVQAIFSFVANWNNFFLPVLLINSKNKRTIPILIAQLRSADYMKFDYGKVYMMITIAIIPLVIIYFILSRYIIRGATMGSVKG